MHHAHQHAHHLAHRITFTDDEPIETPLGSKRRVEGARLHDAVGAHERLAHHEDLIRPGQFGEFLEAGHEARVVVAAAGGVDEDDVEVVVFGVRDGVAGDVGGVFAVALFVEFDAAEVFAVGEVFEVAGVDAELFDGAGAEGVAGRDQEGEVVLEEEEGEFGEGGGFADAVDADDGDGVGALLGCGYVGDGGEKGEGRCRGEEFG